MNDFTVIANVPVDIAGQHYEAGDSVTANCHDISLHLAFGRVRLSNAPAPPIVKRKRGRPRKNDTTAPSYQRRDMRAEE